MKPKMKETLLIIIAIVSALGGLSGVGAVIVAISEKRKKESDAAEVLSSATKELIAPYREDVARYRKELDDCRIKILDLEHTIDIMHVELDGRNSRIRALDADIVLLKDDIRRKDCRILELETKVNALGAVAKRKRPAKL